MRRIAIIESPFKRNGEVSETTHRAYLERLIRYVTLDLGCTPYASHKMLTGALDDNLSEERALGKGAGIDMAKQILRWAHVAFNNGLLQSELRPVILFGTDYGMSDGMGLAEALYIQYGLAQQIERVSIGKNPDNSPVSCSVCGSWCCSC